jgi:hypothetical protein
MKDAEFMHLVEPVNMLIGYCQSASDITSESNLKGWSKRLMELAEKLKVAWEEVALTEQGDEA